MKLLESAISKFSDSTRTFTIGLGRFPRHINSNSGSQIRWDPASFPSALSSQLLSDPLPRCWIAPKSHGVLELACLRRHDLACMLRSASHSFSHLHLVMKAVVCPLRYTPQHTFRRSKSSERLRNVPSRHSTSWPGVRG